MDSFMSIIGSIKPLSSIDTKLIDTYRQSALEKGLTPTGVNINLRAIKTFLRWCQVRGYIEKTPHMDMVSVPKSMPLYIPDRIFAELMKLPWLEQHYKNAFCSIVKPVAGYRNHSSVN